MQGFHRYQQVTTQGEMRTRMTSTRKSIFIKVFVVVTALGVIAANTTVANAAVKKKTITCYKLKAVKKVTAVKPVCAKGWTTKKPVVKVTPKPVTSTPAKASSVAFNGTYKGKMSVLWSDAGVQASSVTASGSGTTVGLDSLTGTGSSSPSDQCAGIVGTGVISGGGNTLKVSFDSSAKGCAADGAAPTVVTITGNATISGGTGKFAGATGTLKATGTFAIKSSAAGFSENTPLTLTLAGNINTK